MAIAELFLGLHSHRASLDFSEIEQDELEAIASLFPLNFDESGAQIKEILDSTYTDGITGLEKVKNDGTQITGVFLDQVSPTVTKRYRFAISPDNISYQLENPSDLDEADFAELEFAASKMFGGSKKPKNCTTGTSCGNGCINKSKKCSKAPTPKQKEAIASLTKRKSDKTSTSSQSSAKIKSTEKSPLPPTKNTQEKVSKGAFTKAKDAKPFVPVDTSDFQPKDIVSNVGLLYRIDNSQVENDKGKTDPALNKEFKAAKNKNLSPGIVVETGTNEYKALDDGYSQQLNNAAGSANKAAMNIVIPNDKKQIELAQALQVPDKNQKTYFQDNRSETESGALSNYGKYMSLSTSKISTNAQEKQHDKSDAEIEAAAKQLRDAGGVNWVPVLLKNVGDNEYEVVGNHFAYDVAKKAGVTRMASVIVEDAESNENSTTKRSRKAV